MIYPDGFMPDGTPVYIKCSRGSSKSTLQSEIYRKLLGISDDEWYEMLRIAKGENYDTYYENVLGNE